MMRLDIASLAAAYRDGRCTPQQMIEHVQDRMRQHEANPIWISRTAPADPV